MVMEIQKHNMSSLSRWRSTWSKKRKNAFIYKTVHSAIPLANVGLLFDSKTFGLLHCKYCITYAITLCALYATK